MHARQPRIRHTEYEHIFTWLHTATEQIADKYLLFKGRNDPQRYTGKAFFTKARKQGKIRLLIGKEFDHFVQTFHESTPNALMDGQSLLFPFRLQGFAISKEGILRGRRA